MIKVAFASDDQQHVNLHFGGGERLAVYDIRPGEAELDRIGQFVTAGMTGANAERREGEEAPPPPEAEAPPEDKIAAKLAFLQGCSAVYAASIGASGIKRLMAAGIQPIIVNKGFPVIELLNEVSLALVHGGLPWVTRAAKKAGIEPAKPRGATIHQLITSIED